VDAVQCDELLMLADSLSTETATSAERLGRELFRSENRQDRSAPVVKELLEWPRGAFEVLGFDPVDLGNVGRFVIVPLEYADAALHVLVRLPDSRQTAPNRYNHG